MSNVCHGEVRERRKRDAAVSYTTRPWMHAIPQLGSSIQMAGKRPDIWKRKGGTRIVGIAYRQLDRGRSSGSRDPIYLGTWCTGGTDVQIDVPPPVPTTLLFFVKTTVVALGWALTCQGSNVQPGTCTYIPRYLGSATWQPGYTWELVRYCYPVTQ